MFVPLAKVVMVEASEDVRVVALDSGPRLRIKICTYQSLSGHTTGVSILGRR